MMDGDELTPEMTSMMRETLLYSVPHCGGLQQ
jgi:hypothetical protein